MIVAIFDPDTGRPYSVYCMDSRDAMAATMATCVPLGWPSRDLTETRFGSFVNPEALPYLDELDAGIRADGKEPIGFKL